MLKFISFGSGSSGNCYYLGTATDGLIIEAMNTRCLSMQQKRCIRALTITIVWQGKWLMR